MSASSPTLTGRAREAGQLLEDARRFLATHSETSSDLAEALESLGRASVEFHELEQTDSEPAAERIGVALDEIQNALGLLERARLTTPSAQGAIAQLARALSLFASHSAAALRARRGVVIEDLVANGSARQNSAKPTRG